MIGTLLLFGATGDLATRFLFPALAALQSAGKLPEGFQVIAAAREDLNSDAFRRTTSESMQDHARGINATAREAILKVSHYRSVDIQDTAAVAEFIRYGADLSGDEPLAVYLALPPVTFGPAITAVGTAGLPPHSRVVLEKPFGVSLKGAKELNMALRRVLGEVGEEAAFLVDHVLGMETVEKLVGLRLENRALEKVWSTRDIRQVAILWEETLALENRAGFYDHTGALKDVVQNHMLQILCLLAMDPPASLEDPELRARKLQIMSALRLLKPQDLAMCTRRARYTAGRLAETGGADGRMVPAYVKEDGVDLDRQTETFAEMRLEIRSGRWMDTRFVLRTGKALHARSKKAVIHFRSPQKLPFAGRLVADVSELHIGIDGPEDIVVKTGTPQGRWLTIAKPPSSVLPPYGRVLLDILRGSQARSVGRYEAEQAWRVVTPVLDAWSRGEVPLEEYPAGSTGPPPRCSR
jgi:glucose-6-phosphate 1-dehydrogenase